MSEKQSSEVYINMVWVNLMVYLKPCLYRYHSSGRGSFLKATIWCLSYSNHGWKHHRSYQAIYLLYWPCAGSRVPGRGEIGTQQAVNYRAVMRTLLQEGNKGYVGHEWIPTTDAMTGLKEALEICDVWCYKISCFGCSAWRAVERLLKFSLSGLGKLLKSKRAMFWQTNNANPLQTSTPRFHTRIPAFKSEISSWGFPGTKMKLAIRLGCSKPN